MSWLRIKSVSAGAAEHFERHLGPRSLTALGVGAIIGSGVFVLTGVAAAEHAGPALVISFILAGICCGFAALCYAEFAAMIPESGSAYSYAYATMGEAIAFFVGWQMVLEYLFAASAVAVGWSGYFNSILDDLGLAVPAMLRQSALNSTSDSLNGIYFSGSIVDITAVMIVMILTIICYRGVRKSSSLNNIIVFIKIAVIVVFIGAAISFIDFENWKPFIPANEGDGRFGWDGVLRATAIVFFTYLGFDAVSTAAQEAKDPQRDMPIGILASLAICTVLYIGVSAVLTGMVPFRELNVSAPIALALDRHPAIGWISIFIKLGALAGMTSVILVMLFAQPRIFYAMSRDGLLPPIFSRIHSQYRTPSFSTIVTGMGAAALAGILPISVLGEIVSFGTLTAFIVVCLGVLILRRTRPDLARPFKVPFAPVICTCGAAASAFLMSQLATNTWILAGAWTITGLVLYLVYGYRHSQLAHPANKEGLDA